MLQCACHVRCVVVVTSSNVGRGLVVPVPCWRAGGGRGGAICDEAAAGMRASRERARQPACMAEARCTAGASISGPPLARARAERRPSEM
eukprot:scaffold10264_cov33-Tisochrysis_lutea.AAC.3